MIDLRDSTPDQQIVQRLAPEKDPDRPSGIRPGQLARTFPNYEANRLHRIGVGVDVTRNSQRGLA